ncbi:hypothetical protein [Ferrimonas aestuarii]|uniref:DNA-binding protein n=1 Tax=Ferrimonas aestuarii TaxID=2569539 RepID=A0A4U1BML9_9GAMM|nr:hypothetical protein [Ferrimonas aestuarii]TKB54540.1 hypothetical protein FCL42_12060 [Ferrimonas aestuarii]
MSSEGMTPAQRAKSHGLESLSEMSELSQVSVNTLKRWAYDKPERFDVVAIGSVAKKYNYKGNTLIFIHHVAKELNIIEPNEKTVP